MEAQQPAETKEFETRYRRLQNAPKQIEALGEEQLDQVMEILRQAKEDKAFCDRRIQAALREHEALVGEGAAET